MGTVYLAEDTNLTDGSRSSSCRRKRPIIRTAAARLLREARAASALDHPHIATIYEVGDHDGRPFIAMAHYEGETLAARLARGPADDGRDRRLVAQMADALEAAHAAKIVHRDLETIEPDVDDHGTSESSGLRPRQNRNGGNGNAAHACGHRGGHGRLHVARTGRRWSRWMHGRISGRWVSLLTRCWAVDHVRWHERTSHHPCSADAAILRPSKRYGPTSLPELEEIVSRTLVRDRDRRTITAADVRDLASTGHARLSSGITACRCAAADVAPHAGRGRGRRARRRREWRRLVGAAQREGPLGAAGGAAGDHQARRRGQVRRGLRSRCRRSHTSLTIHSSPNR